MPLVATPKDAELNAAAVMRSWGYLDAVSPEHGADGGIDVRSSKALAQVKFRSSKAGRPEIQNLIGARESDTTKLLMFFDHKGYSPQAVQYADHMGVGLFVYDLQGNVKAVNQAGRRMMATTAWTRIKTLVMSPDFIVYGGIAIGLVLAGMVIAVSLSE